MAPLCAEFGPRQRLNKPLRQPADATCERSNDGVRFLVGQAHEHDVARLALDEGGNRRFLARLPAGRLPNRLCRLIWKILHQSVRYEECGPAVSEEAKKVRARKMIRELRGLGYQVTVVSPAPMA